jgi:PGF-pre-PGF domain-containing protein
VTRGQTVSVDADATDLDSDPLTYSCNRTDHFTDFNSTTGKGNWTATTGTNYIDFGVSDGYTVDNITVTITVTAHSTSATKHHGGGGGSGGGIALPLPLEYPSEYHESYTRFLKNEEKTITTTSKIQGKTGITEIGAKLEKPATVSATVSKVSSLPSGTPSPGGEVYSTFEVVFTQYGTSSKVEPSGYIEHRVSKEWLNNHGASSSDVQFLKYDGMWIKLSSELVDEDSEYYYYRINLDSFCLFAVVIPEVSPVVPANPTEVVTTIIPSETPTATVTVTVTVTETPLPTQTTPTKSPGFSGLLAIAGLLTVAYLNRRGS